MTGSLLEIFENAVDFTVCKESGEFWSILHLMKMAHMNISGVILLGEG
jgi:hypothetical protein